MSIIYFLVERFHMLVLISVGWNYDIFRDWQEYRAWWDANPGREYTALWLLSDVKAIDHLVDYLVHYQ